MKSKTAIACAALYLASGSASAALRDYDFTVQWTSGALTGQKTVGSFTMNEEVFERRENPIPIVQPTMSNLKQTGMPLPESVLSYWPGGVAPLLGGGVTFCEIFWQPQAGNPCRVNYYDLYGYPSQSDIQFRLQNGGVGSAFRLLTQGQYTVIDTSTGITTLALAPIPEPETYALFAAGLAAVALASRRRRKTDEVILG